MASSRRTAVGWPLGFGRKYAVTPDGQRVLAIVSATVQASHPATVILNWRESINKKV